MVDNFEKYVQTISKAIIEFNGIKYIESGKEVKPPVKKEYELIKDKVNILLLTEHIAVDGFLKDGNNFIKINDAYYSIRKILESLGLTVGWEDGFITADINKDFIPDKENIDLLLLGNKINVNGFNYKDKFYIKIDGVYVLLRGIFENLGFKLEWNRNNNMVLVNRIDSNS